MVTLASISPVHKFDEKRLSSYLSSQGLEDFNSPMLAQQFQGGQSNPTFCLEANSKRYVLRKKASRQAPTISSFNRTRI
jgi:aminoglycoside phosphotransferase (APT) family kinase protein